MKKNLKRIELFDLVKCFAIFMVIWGHTATNSELNGGNPGLLYRVLYSVHMPLFFFLSGLSASFRPLRGWKEWRLFLRKRILTILVPYIVWALVYCSFDFGNVARILYASWQRLCEAETLSSLWYLPTLFLGGIFVQLIVNLRSKWKLPGGRIFYLIPAGVLMIGGYFLPRISCGYFMCANVAVVAAACMLMGIALKDRVIELSIQTGGVLAGVLAGSLAIYVAVVLLLGDGFSIMMMCQAIYEPAIPTLVLALSGGAALLVLGMLLKRLADEWVGFLRLDALDYIGQHTLGIFLLHKPMMQQLIIPGLQRLGFLSEGLARFLGACITLFVSLWLCRLIEYYVPELVGVFRKDVLQSGIPRDR